MPILIAGASTQINRSTQVVLSGQQPCIGVSPTRPTCNRLVVPVILDPIPNSFAITNNNNTTVRHVGSGVYAIEKTGGSTPAYDAGAVASVGTAGDFVLRLRKISQTGSFWYGGGANTDPLASDGNDTIDFLWMYLPGSSTWGIWENGVLGTSGLADLTYAWMWRTGTILGYGRGPDLVTAQASPDRTTTSTGTLYFDSTFSSEGDQVEALFYVPIVDAIAGSASLVLTPAGTVLGRGAVAGSSSVTLSPSGTLSGRGILTGTSTLVLSPSGTITGKGALTGAASLAFAPTAAMSGLGVLSGSIALALIPAGALSGVGSLSGTAPLAFSFDGMLTAFVDISGSASLTFSAAGNVTGIARLSGPADFAFILSGSLTTGPWVLAPRPVLVPITTPTIPSATSLALTSAPLAVGIIAPSPPPLVDLGD